MKNIFRFLFKNEVNCMTKRPTGFCPGCGHDLYDGESECSDKCRDAVEIMMWGYGDGKI